MTVIVALNNVLASDSGCVARDIATGTARPAESQGKLHTLSDRLAFGTFGLSWWPGGSVQAVAAETRSAIADSQPSVEAAARMIGENLHRRAGWRLKEIAARGWPVPPGVEVGERPWCGFIGGLCVGYGPGDECPECWFFCVTASGAEEPVRKYRAGPGQWGVAISPGADYAIAAYRDIVRVPRDTDHAAEMAAALVQAQIDGFAQAPSPHGSYSGPVQILALSPGNPPQVIAPLHAPAAA